MATLKEIACGKNFSSLLFASTSIAITVFLWSISPDKQIPLFIPIVAGTFVFLFFALIIPHYLSLLYQVSELKKSNAIGLPQVIHIEHASDLIEFDQKENEIVRIVTKFSPMFITELEISVIVVDGKSPSHSLFSYGYVELIQSTPENLMQFIIKGADKKRNIKEPTMLKYLEGLEKRNILIYAGKWRSHDR